MGIKYYGDEARLDYCPVCQKTKDNPCFSVNIKSGMYMCHATGESGHIDKFPEIKKELEIESTDSNYVKKEKVINDFSELIINSNPLNEKWYEYLKGRGIENRDNINKLVRLGKYESMMIPVTDGQKVVGVKYRSLDKKLWSEKGSCLDYLLNWQNIEDFEYLIIVEGEIDLLSALEAGVMNTVSLPSGATNLKCIEEQKIWLTRFKKIILALDDDMPGNDARDKIAKLLADTGIPIFKTFFHKRKDINEVLTKSDKETVYKYLVESPTLYKTSYRTFYKNNGCYFYYNEGKTEKITDFVIEVNGFSENYLLGYSNSNGRVKEFKVKIAELLTVKGMAEHLGLFLGSNNIIPRFIDWIKEQNQERYIKEIRHYGILIDEDGKENYYDEDSTIICDKRDLKITTQSEIDFLNTEEKEWLSKNIIYMRNDPIQSLLGICWALGRFHTLNSYPILEVAGTTSIGKTEYVEFISRILFGGKENIKSLSTLSNHQIRSFSSNSNITPWAIDEVKISGKFQLEKATELYSTIRAVYDNKIINQGNTTNKLTEFYLCTPLIISGETELNDVSIKNRMISTHLTKNNKGSFEIYKYLKNSDILEKLGKEALKNRLKDGEIKVNTEILKIKDERQFYNATCLLKGLKALCKIITINTEVINNFIEYINTSFSQEFNVVENFKRLLELVREAEIPYLEDFYKCTPTEHWARFQILYTHISELKNKTNSTLELLDMSTLRKQLIEEGFIEKNSDVQRIKDMLGKDKTIKVVRFQNLFN